jgi:hypothetical protein
VDPDLFARAFLDDLRKELTNAQRRELTDGFEVSVGHVLADLLQSRPQWQQAIAEVAVGVRLARLAKPTQQVVEFDVLLVLRNGVLINIECKTGVSRMRDADETKKDFDAREFNTRNSSSSLAVVWLCSPLPTGLVGHPRFRELHRWREETADSGIPHLAWTLPGQPPSYWLDGELYHVPPFAQGLEALLEPYLPRLL